VTNPTQRDGYLQLLARRSGVEERVLLEELRRPEQAARVVGGTGPNAHVGSKINLEAVLSSPDALDPQAVAHLVKPAEFSLLRLVLLRPYLRDQIDDPGAIEFVSTPAREIWTRLQEVPAAGFDRAAFVESLDPTLAGVVRTMYADPEPLPDDEVALHQALEQSLLTLRRNRLDEEIGAKEFDIREAEAEGDRPAAEQLLQEVMDLKQRRLDLDRQRDTTTVLNQRRQRATAASAASGGNG
jgi:hypothetical protein